MTPRDDLLDALRVARQAVAANPRLGYRADYFNAAEASLDALTARLEEAEAALRKYGEHHEGCASWEGHEIAEPCNCGLHDALARVRGDKT